MWLTIAYSPEAIAEHAMALILTLNRKTHRAFNRVRENNFSLTGLLGHTLYGKTAGVVGTGKIGMCMVRILLGFGMKVLAYDIIQNPEVEQLGGTYCGNLHELLSQSHIVSLHAPLLESTKYMINSESIKSMRPGSLLVNTSRGGLVEHKAIIEALKKRQIGGLAIDVYENEEGLFFKNHEDEIMEDDVIARLMSFPNVLVTGHQAFFTVESLREIAAITVNNFTCWADGKECKNVVS
jgi:D-lactate dehydrogenase